MADKVSDKMLGEVDIRILSLNCWGIPSISKNRDERMNAIAKDIAASCYDIICLQEVWSEDDFIKIKDAACENLEYSHYFFSGVLGSGLCILSRFPIEDVFFHQWAVNGYIHKIQHGDWFGGKGVGLCRLRHAGLSINVYTAHLHAEYNRNCDMYRSHRVLQAFDTAQFIRLTSSSADLVILGGDLNTEPGDLPYRIICRQARLEDSGDKDQQGTNESDRNSYSDPKVTRIVKSGKRIDYIMYKTGPHTNVSLLSYQLPLPPRVPQCSFSYSDHEAVLATLKVKTITTNSPPQSVTLNEEREAALKEGVAECEDALRRLRTERRTYYCYSASLFVMLILISTLAEVYGYWYFDIIRLLVTVGLCFTVFMATIWNRIEINVTRSAKLGMELAGAYASN